MDIKAILEDVIKTINTEEPLPKKVKVCLDKESENKKLKICVEDKSGTKKGSKIKTKKEDLNMENVEEKPKGKRGRPAKPKEEKPKGKRGRPAKLKENVEEKPKGKRGRPAKPKEEKEEKPKGKRGRPAKQKIDLEKNKAKELMSQPKEDKPKILSVDDLKEISKSLKRKADENAIIDLASIVEKAKKIKPKPKEDKPTFIPKTKKSKPIKTINIIKDNKPKGKVIITPNKTETNIEKYLPPSNKYSDKSNFDKEVFLYEKPIKYLKERLMGSVEDKKLKAQFNKLTDKKALILAILDKEQKKYGVIEPVITNALKNPPYSDLKTNEAFKRFMKDREPSVEPVVKPVAPPIAPPIAPPVAKQDDEIKELIKVQLKELRDAKNKEDEIMDKDPLLKKLYLEYFKENHSVSRDEKYKEIEQMIYKECSKKTKGTNFDCEDITDEINEYFVYKKNLKRFENILNERKRQLQDVKDFFEKYKAKYKGSNIPNKVELEKIYEKLLRFFPNEDIMIVLRDFLKRKPKEEPEEETEEEPEDESVIFDYVFEPEEYIINKIPLISYKKELQIIQSKYDNKKLEQDKKEEKEKIRDKVIVDIKKIAEKYKPLTAFAKKKELSKTETKRLDSIFKDKEKEEGEIDKIARKKMEEINKKYDKLILNNDKELFKEEKKLEKQDFEKELIDMLILYLKKLIIKDKTISYNEKENKFLVDIDGDVNKMMPTEMIEAFIEKYNEVNKTNYDVDARKEVDDKEFINWYLNKKGIKKTGSGKTASVARGAGMKTASVVEGRGVVVVDTDKSLLYNLPRRFL